MGQERYTARMKVLRDTKPAYDKYDQALAAARKKDLGTAKSLAKEASEAFPREARFHELLGEIALAQKEPKTALPYYQKAIELNPNYFGSYLGSGVAHYQVGDKAKAEESLKKSADLLPTAPAAYYLGTIARERGDTKLAMEQFRAAATSNSQIGQMAAAEFVRMDLPQNPGNYVGTAGQFDSQGRPILVIQNRAPVALTNIQVTPVLVDGLGNVVQQGAPVRVGRTLKSGEQVAADAGLGGLTQQQLQNLRFRVDGARVAE